MGCFIIKKPHTKRLQKRVFNKSVVDVQEKNTIQPIVAIEEEVLIVKVNDDVVKVEQEVMNEVSENNIKPKKNNVMDTKQKIQMAAEILDDSKNTVKKIKKEKGLVERTESSKTIITEDNRELLRD